MQLREAFLLYVFLPFLSVPASLVSSHGSTDVCASSEDAASGTVLLAVSGNSHRVSRAAAARLTEESLSFLETSSATSEAARMQALSSLAYDSDGDDAHSHEADLEFTTNEEHSTDAFQRYAASHGYSEPADVAFEPAVWNSAPEVRASHNCYMYALNDLSPRSAAECNETWSAIDKGKLTAHDRDVPKVCKRYFHKPGYYFQNVVSGHPSTDIWYREETTCHLMLPMIASDSPNIVWVNELNQTLTEVDDCPESHYMAALFIQPKAGFHFYRRDHQCPDDQDKLCWSHKPGILDATNKDAAGAVIHSVLQADRNYGGLNYSEPCAFFCVPQNSKARTHSDSRRSVRDHALLHLSSGSSSKAVTAKSKH